MKILHVDAGNEWRGGQRQLYYLAKGLSEEGIKQFAIVSSDKLEKKLNAVGVYTYKWRYRFEFHYGFFKYFSILKKIKPDIIHFHDSRSLSLSIFTKLPTIATRRVDFELKSFLSKIKYRKADIIVGVSKKINEILKRSGIDKTELIYDGIDPEELKTDSDKKTCRKKFSFGKPPVFINVAALVDHKGHIYLLKALKILKDRGITPEVHIAGDGNLKEKILNYKKEEKLENVIFHGFVENIAEFLKAGDFFIITSHLEGLCSSIMDAMALKIPIIATKAGGIPELVENTAFLADNKSPQSIADKIIFALENSEKMEELSEKAYERFLKNFTYKIMTQKYLKLYGKFIESNLS